MLSEYSLLNSKQWAVADGLGGDCTMSVQTFEVTSLSNGRSDCLSLKNDNTSMSALAESTGQKKTFPAVVWQ